MGEFRLTTEKKVPQGPSPPTVKSFTNKGQGEDVQKGMYKQTQYQGGGSTAAPTSARFKAV